MEDIILLLVNDKRMKDILTYPVLIEVCDIIDKMYQLGWDERNGGMSHTFLMKMSSVNILTFRR